MEPWKGTPKPAMTGSKPSTSSAKPASQTSTKKPTGKK
jgi:hypothetical protein